MLHTINTLTQQSIQQNRPNQGSTSAKDHALLHPPKSTHVRKVQPIVDEKTHQDDKEQEGRQTYGLSLLELMTDSEYAAFERITAHMSHGERLMAAQSLYRLTSLQQSEGANYPKEMKNGYGNTLNFGDKFSKAVAWGDVSIDKHS